MVVAVFNRTTETTDYLYQRSGTGLEKAVPVTMSRGCTMGIEHSDMQLISEAYQLMREGLGMSAGEIHDVGINWTVWI